MLISEENVIKGKMEKWLLLEDLIFYFRSNWLVDIYFNCICFF